MNDRIVLGFCNWKKPVVTLPETSVATLKKGQITDRYFQDNEIV